MIFSVSDKAPNFFILSSKREKGHLLYLAKVRRGSETHYVLRESCFGNGGCLRYRDLFDLGQDPGLYVEYPGGNGYYYSATLEEALHEENVSFTSEDLDRLFLPFLEPHIRRIVHTFGGLSERDPAKKRYTDRELLVRQIQMPGFDIRRLHYLRCGRMNIGRIDGRPLRLVSPVLDRCRDEIENVIEGMERRLKPREMRSYIYCALDLQAYFGGHPLRFHPEAMNTEEVDGYFLEALCCLNRDKSFFRGVDAHDSRWLHPYLARYVVLYFDNSFAFETNWTDELLEYIRRSRAAGSALRAGSVSADEALGVMRLSAVEFEAMTRKEFIQCYRNRAKEVHPDSGGSHDEFVRLAEAYEYLVVRK